MYASEIIFIGRDQSQSGVWSDLQIFPDHFQKISDPSPNFLQIRVICIQTDYHLLAGGGYQTKEILLQSIN